MAYPERLTVFAELTNFEQLNVIGVDDGVVLVQMNNRPVNALSRTLSDELTRAFDIISELDGIRAVILTGTGNGYCAGADLKRRKDLLQGPGDTPVHLRRPPRARSPCRSPNGR